MAKRETHKSYDVSFKQWRLLKKSQKMQQQDSLMLMLEESENGVHRKTS